MSFLLIFAASAPLSFLDRFDSLYRVIVNAVKEDKLNERDFYLIISAKAKSMNQERRKKTLLLNESLIKGEEKR